MVTVSAQCVKRYLVVVLLMAHAYSAFSSSTSRLRYGGKQSDLPAVGLRFTTFRDMKSIPFPPPQQTGRVWTRRDNGQKIFGYNLIEQWRHDQIIGQWKNDHMTLVVAEVKVNIPRNVPTIDPKFDDVLEQSYKLWTKSKQKPVSQRGEGQWLHFYTGVELAGNLSYVSGCKNTTYQYSLMEASDKAMVYLVRSKRDPSRRFMFYYQSNTHLDKKGKQAVLYSIKSVYTYKPKNAKVVEVRGSSQYKKREWSDKYLESKKQIVASIQNMKGWKILETENYIIVSNMRSGITVKSFQVQLEKSRIAYQAFFPLKVKLDEVSVVKIFGDRSEYLSYVGQEMKWTGGLWMPLRKELMVSPLDTKSSSKNKMGMLETASHEGFHQYIYHAVNQSMLSTWFNEGTAAFFEGLKFSGSRSFKVGTTARLPGLKLAIKKGFDNIEKLINMSQPEYYRADRVEYNYALGWGLMFYLYKGARLMRRPQYTEVPERYYAEMLRSHNAQKATKYAWSKINMSQFQKDFRIFWRSRGYIGKAEKLDIQRELLRR